MFSHFHSKLHSVDVLSAIGLNCKFFSELQLIWQDVRVWQRGARCSTAQSAGTAYTSTWTATDARFASARFTTSSGILLHVMYSWEHSMLQLCTLFYAHTGCFASSCHSSARWQRVSACDPSSSSSYSTSWEGVYSCYSHITISPFTTGFL